MTPQPAFSLIQRPLEAQIRSLNVAVRAHSTRRAWQHAANAVALINEATDLNLRAEDLLRALLELGVKQRLIARGSMVEEDGVRRFTVEDEALRAEVRELLGERRTDFMADPRWADLLDS